ncbi:NAD(P)-binding protein [Mycena vitilis]|nr:NAD(P)-binding protein [Mycena vitilis]
MPTITIFGATGTQGSSVVNAVLEDGRYKPRAVSRNPASGASKALIARGVEVVKGDLFDKESLKRAMHGSEAVFGVTDFWDSQIFGVDPTGKDEIVQGKNLVDVAKEVGVAFFIWSSLPNATEESNGLYTHIHHVDNKAMIEDYLKASGVPHAMLLTGWFTEDLWTRNYLQKTANGYTIPVAKYGPDEDQVFTWVANDLGSAAVALLTHYPDASKGILGKSYPVVSFRATYPQLATAIAKEIGKEVTFTPLETERIGELDEMYLFMARIGWYNETPVPNPDLSALGARFGSMEEFVKAEIVPRFA